MENNTVIKVEHVSKKFNIYRKDIQKIISVLFGKEPSEIMYALDDVSFEVARGERVNVFGVLGAGRSTLLNTICGVSLPSKGRVGVKGKINAMLFAKAGLEMEFSCRENVFMKANVVGLPKARTNEVVDDVLEFAELKDFAAIPLKRASRGAPTLLSLAVHLSADADIIVMDEAFSGGGNYVRSKCEERFRDYIRDHEDVTLLMASNHWGYVKEICPRSIVLDEGKIIFDGDTDEAIAIYREVYKRTQVVPKDEK